nr:hypothetical protein [Tanacetum cinerariifolium]
MGFPSTLDEGTRKSQPLLESTATHPKDSGALRLQEHSLRRAKGLCPKSHPLRPRYVETKFPAIVLNDELTPEKELSCEPTVSSLNNNKIHFRISFDESDDEDYTVIFNKNSFSYNIISVNNLKTDSKNDNKKVNMPSFLSPEPTVSYFDDLDFLKDFENEFPAFVYNDALTFKLDFLIEPVVSPQHINEFDLKTETSFSKCDGKEQNVTYFNDLFHFNIIYPDDLESDRDNDDNEIDIIQSSEGKIGLQGRIRRIRSPYTPYQFSIRSIPIKLHMAYPSSLDTSYLTSKQNNKIFCTNFVDFEDMALPPRDQRHQYLRFEGLQYTNVDITDFEMRLGKIYRREVHWVLVLYFDSLSAEMGEWLTGRMLMEHRDAQGQSVFTSRAWRRLFDMRGPLVFELIMKFFSTFSFCEAILDIDVVDTLQFQFGEAKHCMSWRLIACSIAGRSHVPKKVIVTDLFYLKGMDVGSVNIPYLLARYLRRFASGRKQGAMISRGQFIAYMAEHFRLLTKERLQRLKAWVASGLERQPDVTVGQYDNQRAINVVGARENVDDEPEDHELEAHYMFMEKIQEVIPDVADYSRPIFDTEPL